MEILDNTCHIGIDLGGTNIRGGVVNGNVLQGILSRPFRSMGSVESVLEELFSLTDELMKSVGGEAGNEPVGSIGIGVPGLVNVEEGIIYDLVNIPSWNELPLRKWMEDRYQIPVAIDNDANCFVLGEFYFGKGRGCDAMIGITIGTGLGSGIIIDGKLYSGRHGGAGEFGMVDYLDRCYEYYASGQFFKNIYQTEGEDVFMWAKAGDVHALKMYEEMGTHLGNFIKMILYSLDPGLIILGGSVRHAWPFFYKSMSAQIQTFAFRRSLQGLRIEISALENAGIFGAAVLQRR
jgi:glucokinase